MRFPLKTVIDFRPCGECQACCTVVGIKELNKPAFQRCGHQCESGCDIYEDRPETCRGYYCLWAAGLLEGDERRRPDRLGVIFDFRPLDNSERVATGKDLAIQAWEVWPGALADSDWLLRRIADRYPVLTVKPA
jgi:hypothetical protein